MKDAARETYEDRLHARAWAIIDRHRAGHYMPIIWKLAVRGNPEGQTELARLLTVHEPYETAKNRSLALRFARQAAARGHAAAMYNLAMTYRNRRDMGQYRYWLARAANIDPSDRAEHKAFRIRFPHPVMRRWHRCARER